MNKELNLPENKNKNINYKYKNLLRLQNNNKSQTVVRYHIEGTGNNIFVASSTIVICRMLQV